MIKDTPNLMACSRELSLKSSTKEHHFFCLCMDAHVVHCLLSSKTFSIISASNALPKIYSPYLFIGKKNYLANGLLEVERKMHLPRLKTIKTFFGQGLTGTLYVLGHSYTLDRLLQLFSRMGQNQAQIQINCT